MVAIPVQGKEGGFSKKFGRTSETFTLPIPTLVSLLSFFKNN
jgi:hypothetical protein